MNTMTIKTIDINAKEWFDKVNGNSYFSAKAIVNYGMDDEKTFKLPFQYGYGEHYTSEAWNVISKEYDIHGSNHGYMSIYCRENGIVLRTNKETNCLQRDCKRFVA